MPKENGFSLIELLVTLLIAAILTAIAFPSLSSLFAKQQAEIGLQNMLRSLALARSEAIKRSGVVSVTNANGRWEEGWQVFADINESGSLDAGEPVLFQQPQIANFPVRGNNPAKLFLRYRADGRLFMPNGAFQAGSIFFCPEISDSPSYKLTLSRSGRARSEKLPSGSESCSIYQGHTTQTEAAP